MATPEDLTALADRIDHEQLWQREPRDDRSLTQEQSDRLWAGIHLRRYAGEYARKLRALPDASPNLPLVFAVSRWPEEPTWLRLMCLWPPSDGELTRVRAALTKALSS